MIFENCSYLSTSHIEYEDLSVDGGCEQVTPVAGDLDKPAVSVITRAADQLSILLADSNIAAANILFMIEFSNLLQLKLFSTGSWKHKLV